ncbi:MAG: hypothetical protein SVT52_08670 [Planctomycetota bacterium]|nr:hypothetical protein [Planctomycetota bacterium]
MEVERKTIATVHHVVSLVFLALLAWGLAVVLDKALAAASSAEGDLRRHLVGLAWLAAALLALTLVMMLWVAVRFVLFRARLKRQQAATKYVDAWSLAGKRFELDEDENDEL